jgi:hypothetical protein
MQVGIQEKERYRWEGRNLQSWLVAKSYTQKEGIYYEETFSPIAILKFIYVLLAIVCHYDYEIWQVDVKTTFLNSYLSEDIYIFQPECFVAKRQKHMVCKLKKFIFGLKQISRVWNIPFD